jgi:hypothetical protein
VTRLLAEKFEKVTELELELSSLLGNTSDDINHVSKFVWAQVLAENLSNLSTNRLMTEHYLKSVIFASLDRDLSDLNSYLKSNESIASWSQEYKKGLQSLASLLLETCTLYETQQSNNLFSVLKSLVPSSASKSLHSLGLHVVDSSLKHATGGRGGSVLLGMTKEAWVEDAAQIAERVMVDDIPEKELRNLFWCPLLE